MASQLNIIGTVAIDSDVPTHRDVQIIVRREEVRVTQGVTLLAQKDGVVAVERQGVGGWLIRFADGTSWAAALPERKLPGGCGCG